MPMYIPIQLFTAPTATGALGYAEHRSSEYESEAGNCSHVPLWLSPVMAFLSPFY